MNKEQQIFEWTYEEVAQERIDKFLAKTNEAGWTRSQIQHWIKEGYVQVNRQMIKANYKLQPNDQIVLVLPAPKESELKPEAMDLDIRYEDEHILVINKPKGMVVHPSVGHYSGTLVNGLLAHCADLSGINGVLRPGIVHRLDKDTSGLLVVAKHDQAHLSLAQQFKEHQVIRRYLALVHGQMTHDRGTIEAPLGRDPVHRQKMSVIPDGKEAITHFMVRERFDRYSLVELQLETGRTHQIRVHLKYIGFPLVGDPKYGPSKTLAINGQALHAYQLGFHHPFTQKYMEFMSELPPYFESLLEKLRQKQ